MPCGETGLCQEQDPLMRAFNATLLTERALIRESHATLFTELQSRRTKELALIIRDMLKSFKASEDIEVTQATRDWIFGEVSRDTRRDTHVKKRMLDLLMQDGIIVVHQFSREDIADAVDEWEDAKARSALADIFHAVYGETVEECLDRFDDAFSSDDVVDEYAWRSPSSIG